MRWLFPIAVTFSLQGVLLLATGFPLPGAIMLLLACPIWAARGVLARRAVAR